MRYISHLDFVRLIYRVLRRADIPFVLTSGFSPHPKVKFGPALKLGKEASMEVIFFLSCMIEIGEIKRRLQEQLTEGIGIIDIQYEK